MYLQAAGYGIVYFAKKMLADKGISLEGKRCLITGSDSVSTDTAVCTCWLILLCNDYFCLDAIKRFFSSHLFGVLYFVFCLFFFVFYFTSFCVCIIMFILFYYFILLFYFISNTRIINWKINMSLIIVLHYYYYTDVS